jgi:hypothetical protein
VVVGGGVHGGGDGESIEEGLAAASSGASAWVKERRECRSAADCCDCGGFGLAEILEPFPTSLLSIKTPTNRHFTVNSQFTDLAIDNATKMSCSIWHRIITTFH